MLYVEGSGLQNSRVNECGAGVEAGERKNSNEGCRERLLDG